MSTEEILIRIEGRAGRITLNRPKALNALTWDMCLKIDAALQDWEANEQVALVLIDGAGEKAFCAGGDIAVMYETGCAGDFGYGQRFWADEYRMNHRLFTFPKPVVTLMGGFAMGGGIGVGGHGSHRIVSEDSVIAMPEVSIGIVPDVGGSLILARAPGRIGEYLGVTAARMGPGDAIHAGFADYFIPRASWPALIAELTESGDWEAVDRAAQPAPDSPLKAAQKDIDWLFGGETLRDVMNALTYDGGAFAQDAMKRMSRNAPLAQACAIELIHRVRARDSIEAALDMEYRFTYRAAEQGDFLEGIRAAIIDKDRSPRWKHESWEAVKGIDVSRMLQPLGAEALNLGGA